MHIEVHPDPEALAIAAADHVAAWLTDPGHTTVGLAGGSTPARAYAVLRERSLPWERIVGWTTDERHVPLDHPDSNARMAGVLFDHVPALLHPVPYARDPGVSASSYTRLLDSMFGTGPVGLVLLGVGSDGHTASLFPGTAALDERDRPYVENRIPHLEVWRLTATVPLLARAARTVFIVSGPAKADAIAAVLGSGTDLPAGVVSRASPDPWWLLDEDAAAGL